MKNHPQYQVRMDHNPNSNSRQGQTKQRKTPAKGQISRTGNFPTEATTRPPAPPPAGAGQGSGSQAEPATGPGDNLSRKTQEVYDAHWKHLQAHWGEPIFLNLPGMTGTGRWDLWTLTQYTHTFLCDISADLRRLLVHPERLQVPLSDPVEQTGRKIQLAQVLALVDSLLESNESVQSKPFEQTAFDSVGLLNFRTFSSEEVLEYLCWGVIDFVADIDALVKEKDLEDRLRWAEVKVILYTVLSIIVGSPWLETDADGLNSAEREALDLHTAFWNEKNARRMRELQQARSQPAAQAA